MRTERLEITGALNAVSVVALLTSWETSSCTSPSLLIVGVTASLVPTSLYWTTRSCRGESVGRLRDTCTNGR